MHQQPACQGGHRYRTVGCNLCPRVHRIGFRRHIVDSVDNGHHDSGMVLRTHVLQHHLPRGDNARTYKQAVAVAHRHRHRPVHQLPSMRTRVQGIMHKHGRPHSRRLEMRKLLQLPHACRDNAIFYRPTRKQLSIPMLQRTDAKAAPPAAQGQAAPMAECSTDTTTDQPTDR